MLAILENVIGLRLRTRIQPGVDPTLLNDFEMATNGNGDDEPPLGGGDLLVLDLRTMEELCQPTLNGRGGPIAPIAIQTTNFGLKNDMIQQVQNSCQFHGLSGDDANKHLDKFLHVTQSIKVNGVTDDAFRLYLFPHSLTHYATAWFDRLPRNSITTFEQMAKMFLGKYFPPSMVTKLRNKITNFRQRLDESLFEAWERYKLSIDRCPNHNMLPVTQIDTFYNGLTLRHCDTINAAGGTFMKRPTVGQTQNVYAAGAYNQGGNSYQPQGNHNLLSYRSDNYLGPPGFNQNQNEAIQIRTTKTKIEIKETIIEFLRGTTKEETNSSKELVMVKTRLQLIKPRMNTVLSSGSGTLPNNTITNPKEDLKGITTRSGIAYKGPTIPTTSSPPKVVECGTEVTKDTVPPTNNGSTKDVQPSVVQIETQIPNYEPVVSPVVEPVEALVSAPKPNPKPSIPYPSRLHDQKLRDNTNDQKEKIFKSLKIWISTLASRMLSFSCLITFNIDQTLRYSANYDAMSVNRIDLIDIACEEYSQEVLGFSVSGNPTPSTKLIVFNSSPTLTPFGDSDF
nr:reverse transcriptase domain-containing protein [Tanacetum cinerariifolium]